MFYNKNDPWFFSLTDENDQIKTHDGPHESLWRAEFDVGTYFIFIFLEWNEYFYESEKQAEYQ